MDFLDKFEEQERFSPYQDIDTELLERVAQMEKEYLFPDKSWHELNPEDQALYLESHSIVSSYYE